MPIKNNIKFASDNKIGCNGKFYYDIGFPSWLNNNSKIIVNASYSGTAPDDCLYDLSEDYCILQEINQFGFKGILENNRFGYSDQFDASQILPAPKSAIYAEFKNINSQTGQGGIVFDLTNSKSDWDQYCYILIRSGRSILYTSNLIRENQISDLIQNNQVVSSSIKISIAEIASNGKNKFSISAYMRTDDQVLYKLCFDNQDLTVAYPYFILVRLTNPDEYPYSGLFTNGGVNRPPVYLTMPLPRLEVA